MSVKNTSRGRVFMYWCSILFRFLSALFYFFLFFPDQNIKHKIKKKVKECPSRGFTNTPTLFCPLFCFIFLCLAWLLYWFFPLFLFFLFFFLLVCYFSFCFVLFHLPFPVCFISFVCLVIQLSIGSFHIILVFGFNYFFLFCFRVDKP